MEKERTEILLEAILDQVKVIAEEHKLLNRKIDRLETKLEETRQEFNGKLSSLARHFNQRMDKLDQRTDKLEGLMDKLERRVDKLDQKLDHVADELAAHRADTEAHRSYLFAES